MKIRYGGTALAFAVFVLIVVLAYGGTLKYIGSERIYHRQGIAGLMQMKDFKESFTQDYLMGHSTRATLTLFGVAVIEELIFRLIPFMIVCYVRPTRAVFITVLIVTSILFGLAHGSYQAIFIQGVGGLCFGLVMLRSDNNLIMGYLYAVAMHLLYDVFIALLTIYLVFGLHHP